MPFQKIASGTGAAVSGAPVFSRRCAGYPGPAALAGPDPSARRSGPRRVGGLRRGAKIFPFVARFRVRDALTFENGCCFIAK